jgi:hypothetical protein
VTIVCSRAVLNACPKDYIEPARASMPIWERQGHRMVRLFRHNALDAGALHPLRSPGETPRRQFKESPGCRFKRGARSIG